MKNYLYELFEKAAHKLDYLKDVDIVFSVPKQESHGDFSTNAAMLLTKKLKTDEELKGLVYSLTPRIKDDSKHWYQKPGIIAIIVGIMALALSILFW